MPLKRFLELDADYASELYIKLNPQREDMARGIGLAVTFWSGIETMFVLIFSTASKMPVEMTASMFTKVKTFSLLLDMCDSVVSSHLGDKKEQAHWNSIVEYARELSGDRNYMAHQPFVTHGVDDDTSDRPPEVELLVGPNVLATLAGETERKEPLNKIEIDELGADFQELYTFLNDFNEHLKAGAPSDDKFQKPISRRRPPRNERREGARRARRNPPQSSRA